MQFKNYPNTNLTSAFIWAIKEMKVKVGFLCLQIVEMFDWLVQPCLDYIARECRFLVQTSPIHLAYSLMRLFTCLIGQNQLPVSSFLKYMSVSYFNWLIMCARMSVYVAVYVPIQMRLLSQEPMKRSPCPINRWPCGCKACFYSLQCGVWAEPSTGTAGRGLMRSTATWSWAWTKSTLGPRRSNSPKATSSLREVISGIFNMMWFG